MLRREPTTIQFTAQDFIDFIAAVNEKQMKSPRVKKNKETPISSLKTNEHVKMTHSTAESSLDNSMEFSFEATAHGGTMQRRYLDPRHSLHAGLQTSHSTRGRSSTTRRPAT